MKNPAVFTTAILAYMLCSVPALHADTPVYSGGILKVPAVISTSNNIAYQDVAFMMNSDGSWVITEGRVSDLAPLNSLSVLPSGPELNVIVEGYMPDGCSSEGEILQAREDRTFHIVIPMNRPEGMICTQAARMFQQRIILDISGIEPGEYQVKVNSLAASFEVSGEDASGDENGMICCRINCCTCGPDYYHDFTYIKTSLEACARPGGIVGGNCYAVVDMSRCDENADNR